jgi:hypothetical protein
MTTAAGPEFTYATEGARLELDVMLAALVKAVYDACEHARHYDDPMPAIDDVGLEQVKAIQHWAVQHVVDSPANAVDAMLYRWLRRQSGTLRVVDADGHALLQIYGELNPMTGYLDDAIRAAMAKTEATNG